MLIITRRNSCLSSIYTAKSSKCLPTKYRPSTNFFIINSIEKQKRTTMDILSFVSCHCIQYIKNLRYRLKNSPFGLPPQLCYWFMCYLSNWRISITVNVCNSDVHMITARVLCIFIYSYAILLPTTETICVYLCPNLYLIILQIFSIEWITT